MTATENWLVELSELASIKGNANIESVRAFLSNKEDQIRLPYARTITSYPRRSVFIGTTNSDTPLVDNEGNRRFWVVSVGTVDNAGLEAARDQIWAEAVAAFDKGEEWWLTPQQQQIADEENDVYRIEVPQVAQVYAWIEKCHRLPEVISAYQLAIGIGYDVNSAAESRVQNGLHAACRQMGWVRTRRRIGDDRPYVYIIPESIRRTKKAAEGQGTT